MASNKPVGWELDVYPAIQRQVLRTTMQGSHVGRLGNRRL
jgi:hypothetical protein